jgi:hypothetical protein
VGGLKVMKIGFMDPDSFLQLLDILRSALSKSSLRLPVTLFPFLGSSINLRDISTKVQTPG